MALTNIPIDITEVAGELEAGDDLLSVFDLQELKAVAPFDGMKPGPENFPGSMILRRCTKGRVLCRQGDEGATAFQILSREDALKVLNALLRGVSTEESAFDDALKQTTAEFQRQTDADNQESVAALRVEILQLQRRRDAREQSNLARRESLKREIERLEQTLRLPVNQPELPPREVVNARLLVSTGIKRKGLLHRLMDKLRGQKRGRSAANEIPEYIPNDGPQDLDINTLSAPMYEGDLFGEMSCLNLAPRSATVIATEGAVNDPVYMIEMVRNALDALRGNVAYRQRMDQTYRSRVMEKQVRSLPLFRVLTDDEYKWLADKLELVEFKAGDVIFDEHDSSVENCYVVRTGVVKVSQNLGCLLGDGDLPDVPALCR
ncbi:MAG: cyclic nucleotide-binding domain-containing protein, partial [Planctomycetota bacterium]|nr:cyclic nucleotide-binding domain-containing protein [Planctomycetota bacterium]